MILKQDKDSIYIRADTFFSGRLSDLAISERKAFIADSLHKHYIDSLFQRSSDSLHLTATDSLRLTDTTALFAPDSTGRVDSTHHITVKDESHKIHRDTLQIPEVPEKYRESSGKDSTRSRSDSTRAIAGRDSALAASKKADSTIQRPQVIALSTSPRDDIRGRARSNDTGSRAATTDTSLRYIR